MNLDPLLTSLPLPAANFPADLVDLGLYGLYELGFHRFLHVLAKWGLASDTVKLLKIASNAKFVLHLMVVLAHAGSETWTSLRHILGL